MAKPLINVMRGIALGAFGVLCSTSKILADDVIEKKEGLIQFDVQAQALVSLWASVCEQDVDVISCQGGVLLTGLELSGQYRVTRRAALGVIGAIDWEPGYDQRTLLLWCAAVDGRLYPYIGRKTDLWLAIEAGMVGAHGWLIEVDPDLSEKKIQDRQLGPETGASLGVNIKMSNRLALSFTARALWLIFSDSPRDSVSSHLELDQAFWLQLGLGLRWQGPV